MVLGRSVLSWVLAVFIAVCVFILAKWAIPVLFALVGFIVPPQIASVLAILIAVGVVFYPPRIP